MQVTFLGNTTLVIKDKQTTLLVDGFLSRPGPGLLRCAIGTVGPSKKIIEDELDCRFFYPRCALDWQRQVNTYTSRALRERRIRVQRIVVTPMDYAVWKQL